MSSHTVTMSREDQADMPETARLVVQVLTAAFGGDEALLDDHPEMASLQQALPRLFGAFPDLTAACRQVLSDGDRVATHWVLRGTYTGAVFGIAPTGRAVEFQNVPSSTWHAHGW